MNIPEHNIDNYLGQLATADDEPTRAELLRLLVGEEDKLARTREELVKAERRAADGRFRIKSLLSVAARLNRAGHDVSRTIVLLVTLQHTQKLLEGHYQKLCDELGKTN